MDTVTIAGDSVTVASTAYAGGDPYAQDYSLTFSSADGSNVPVPAAAWLFGSALVGLAGVGRKRKAA